MFYLVQKLIDKIMFGCLVCVARKDQMSSVLYWTWRVERFLATNLL